MIDKFEGTYRFLSNFWPVSVLWAGVEWPSSEHAYQGAKFNDPKKTAKLLANPDPVAAKRIGRTKGMRPDWDDVKLDIMREIVHCKFDQHHMLANALKNTAPHELVEGNWWGDTYWGKCNGRGENYLGRILMEERAWLLSQSTSTTP